jgi:hypothetical protein
MQSYTRNTYEASFHELQFELIEAIREHAMLHQFGSVEREALICCETASYNKKVTGFLGNPITGVTDPIRYTAILVTPEWFVAARTGSETGTNTISARLADIEMREYEMTHPEANMGIVIFGYLTGVPQTMESIWGLGPGKASDRLKSVMRDAISKAREAKSA